MSDVFTTRRDNLRHLLQKFDGPRALRLNSAAPIGVRWNEKLDHILRRKHGRSH